MTKIIVKEYIKQLKRNYNNKGCKIVKCKIMKKRILFTIDSLTIGGAEKSLVTLLNLLDYSRCEVDLQLFAYNGAFMSFLPKEVNVLPPLNYYDFLALPIWEQLLYPRMLLRRLWYSIRIRKNKIIVRRKIKIEAVQ